MDRKEFEKHASEPLVDRLTIALKHFVSQRALNEVQSEVELAANLSAYLASVLPSLKSNREPLLRDSQGVMRPDFLITENDHSAVIEVKRYKSWGPSIEKTARDQVRRYMSATNAEVGILLLVPKEAIGNGETSTITMATPIDGDRYFVIIRGASRPNYMDQNA